MGLDYRRDSRPGVGIVDVLEIPCEQKMHPSCGGDTDMKRAFLAIRGYRALGYKVFR